MNVMYFSRMYIEPPSTEGDIHVDVKTFFERIATELDGTYDGVVSITLEYEDEED